MRGDRYQFSDGARQRLQVFALAAAMLGVAFTSPAGAQPAAAKSATEPMQIVLVRNKIVLVDGKETRQSALQARPGDILEEVATYANKTTGPLRDVAATLPVPPNTELVMSSVKPGNAKASTDGSVFSDMPLKRRVRQANGVETEQTVPLSEYRYLRWYPGVIAAGTAREFSARFKVADDNKTPAAGSK